MKLAAAIVETRRITWLQKCIDDHVKHLPDHELFVFSEKDVKVNTMRDYNNLLTSINFWSQFLDYDRVLIFQTDSMILRPGIEEFYEWDYVGSPWKFQYKGGNGGLSLRNPKAMLKTITRHVFNSFSGNEDVYFCNNLEGKLAPREVCEKWGCETIFKLGTFGYHAIKNYLSKSQCDEIKNQYSKHRRLSSRSELV